jgi:hypothetical protein
MHLNLNLLVKNVLYKYNLNCAKYFNKDILQQIRIFTIYNDTAKKEK